jgi:hypothetical protein
MVRVILLVLFVGFFQRIPTDAVPYFISILLLISVFLAVRGILGGYFYYYDFLTLILFSVALATWLLSPDKEASWLIRYRGQIVYPLLAIAVIIPPILSWQAFHFRWKAEPLAVPLPFIVLWGSTFILISIMLWFGASTRTPVLVLGVMTMPMRAALVWEFKMGKTRPRIASFKTWLTHSNERI